MENTSSNTCTHDYRPIGQEYISKGFNFLGKLVKAKWDTTRCEKCDDANYILIKGNYEK